MEEELVDRKTAILARKKGFDEPTHCYFWNDKNYVKYMRDSVDYSDLHYQNHFKDINIDENSKGEEVFTISLPTQSLLQRWLREERNVDITICRSFGMKSSYHYFIIIDNNSDNEIQQYISPNRSYEKCLEEGLFKALMIIK